MIINSVVLGGFWEWLRVPIYRYLNLSSSLILLPSHRCPLPSVMHQDILSFVQLLLRTDFVFDNPQLLTQDTTYYHPFFDIIMCGSELFWVGVRRQKKRRVRSPCQDFWLFDFFFFTGFSELNCKDQGFPVQIMLNISAKCQHAM